MWILWIHDPFLELPPKTHNPFFLDSEIRIWIFPKKRTLYVDGRCDSHTQFPRSPLGTPGTMNPPRIYWPPNTKKTKTACLFGLSLLRSPSKKGLHFKTLAPTEAQEKKGLHFQTLAPTEGQEKNGLHFQTLAPTEAQEKKACILRVSLRNKMTAFRKWTENDYKLAHFLFIHIQGCIFSKYIYQFFVSSVSTWQYDFR